MTNLKITRSTEYSTFGATPDVVTLAELMKWLRALERDQKAEKLPVWESTVITIEVDFS